MSEQEDWENEGGYTVIWCDFCKHWTSLAHDCQDKENYESR